MKKRKSSKPSRVKLVRSSNGNVSIYLGSLYDSQHYGKADLADRIKHLVERGYADPTSAAKALQSTNVRETRRYGVLVRKRAD